MTLNENYTTAEKKAKDPTKENEKTELSNDAFALGELLEILINKLEHLRISAIRK